MEAFKFYEVGGKIRDEFLGLTNKDVDYVAVPNTDDTMLLECYTANEMFAKLEHHLREEGFEIFLVTPDCYTIRARFPNWYKYQGVADFVMARKEVGYIPGTRTPIVVPGNLYDDLSRRDFTVNAMAKDPDTGEIIDYFNGKEDISNALIRTPLDPIVTFDDDPLRILRAIRFAVTKRFTIEDATWMAMMSYDYNSKMPVVSEERIREELAKCFRCNTLRTLGYLNFLPTLRDYIFTRTNLWLKPTNEK
jgi:tRNA nucleotidyltransferase/poly(A) polymerase